MSTTATVSPPPFDPRVRAVAARVDSEYQELPGLSLTAAQARRLWRLDPVTCDRVLESLVRAGHLRRTPDGMYVHG
jgi:hypothetical protein